MIAGETELILHEDFNTSTYDPEFGEDMEYDDFWIFSSKAKKAERRAKRADRKAGRIAKRTAKKAARRNNPRRIARQERSQGFFSSIGGVQGIGSAIDALINAPKPAPSIGTIPAEQDYELALRDRKPESKESDNTLYWVGGAAVVLVGIIGVIAVQNQKNQ